MRWGAGLRRWSCCTPLQALAEHLPRDALLLEETPSSRLARPDRPVVAWPFDP